MKSLSENKAAWLYIITFIFLLGYTFFSDRGLIRVYQLSNERDHIKTRARQIEIENEKLYSKKLSLENDMNRMEKAARAELDLVREDEILYKFTK